MNDNKEFIYKLTNHLTDYIDISDYIMYRYIKEFIDNNKYIIFTPMTDEDFENDKYA